MAQQFKNKIFTIDTTGSNVDAITCPAGKTIVIRNVLINKGLREDGNQRKKLQKKNTRKCLEN